MYFPLCSDFYPHGEVTHKYGILREGPPVPGICERAAFIIDKNGILVWATVYPLDQTPDVEELLGAVREIGLKEGNEGLAAICDPIMRRYRELPTMSSPPSPA